MDERITKIYNRVLELIQRQLNAKLKGRSKNEIEMGLIRLFELCNRINRNVATSEPTRDYSHDFDFIDDESLSEPDYQHEYETLSAVAFKKKYGEELYTQIYSKNLLEQTKK